MKNGKRSIFMAALAAVLALGMAVTAYAASPVPEELAELPPPIAKNVIGTAMDMEVLGRGKDCFVDDGEIVVYTAYVRNDTEDPWEGDVYFTVPLVESGLVQASGNPEVKLGCVTWKDVRLEPFANVTYYIIVSNQGNALPESFLATLVAAGHDGCPHGHASIDGYCGVPALYGKMVRKADKDILEIHNDALKGGASKVRVWAHGDVTGKLKKEQPDNHYNPKYDERSNTTELMLGGLSACGGAEQPGLSIDVTGLEVTGITFDACGEEGFAMQSGDGGLTWSMPLVKGYGYVKFGTK